MRIAISDNDVKRYGGLSETNTAHLERRARLFPPKTVAALPVAAQPQPVPVTIPLAPTPLQATIYAIAEAVAVRLNLNLHTVLSDATSSVAQMARKVAAGVAVRRLEIPIEDAAVALGIYSGAVIDGLLVVDGALREFAIPRACPLDAMLNLIFSNTSVDMQAPRATVEEIKRVTASHFKVTMTDMSSNRRTANVVRPRQMAMAIAKQLTLRSLPELGRRFGGRDHTTILHGVRKFKSAIESAAATLPPNAEIIDWVRAVDQAAEAQGV